MAYVQCSKWLELRVSLSLARWHLYRSGYKVLKITNWLANGSHNKSKEHRRWTLSFITILINLSRIELHNVASTNENWRPLALSWHSPGTPFSLTPGGNCLYCLRYLCHWCSQLHTSSLFSFHVFLVMCYFVFVLCYRTESQHFSCARSAPQKLHNDNCASSVIQNFCSLCRCISWLFANWRWH